MLVFGGLLETGNYCNQLFSYEIDLNDWGQVTFTEQIAPFS